MYTRFALLTFVVNVLLYCILNKTAGVELSVLNWIMHAVVCAVVFNAAAILAFMKNEEFRFYCCLLRKFLSKISRWK